MPVVIKRWCLEVIGIELRSKYRANAAGRVVGNENGAPSIECP